MEVSAIELSVVTLSDTLLSPLLAGEAAQAAKASIDIEDNKLTNNFLIYIFNISFIYNLGTPNFFYSIA
jgi:hypothetical protein